MEIGKECSDVSALFRLNTGLQGGRGTGSKRPVPHLLLLDMSYGLFILHFQKLTSRGLVGQISPSPHPTSTSVLVFDQVLEEGTESGW